MNEKTSRGLAQEAYFVAALAAAVMTAGFYITYRLEDMARARAQAHISSWREGPKLTTKLLMERYGPPDELAPEAASWFERGSWKRIVVYADAPFNYLEQTIGYKAPHDRVQEVRALDHGVRIDAAKEELTAVSNQESLNFLALNLANEIASGSRSAKDGRDAYLRMAQLAAAGKASAYLDGLMFKPYRPMPRERWGREISY